MSRRTHLGHLAPLHTERVTWRTSLLCLGGGAASLAFALNVRTLVLLTQILTDLARSCH